MRILLRHLRPFWPIVLVVLALLAAQAMLELELPAYTSDIVDVGITQSGVTTTIPEVIRQSALDDLASLMPSAEAGILLDSYEPYPGHPYTTSEPILRLKPDADTAALREPLSMAMAIGAMSTQLAGGSSGEADAPQSNPFGVLRAMPELLRSAMINQIRQRLSAVPESQISQIAITAVKAEYDAIGAPSKQVGYIAYAGLKMLAIALLGAAASIGVGYFSSRIAAGLGKTLRKRTFERVVSYGSQEIGRFSTASLITRCTNDIQQIQQMVVMLLRTLVFSPIMAVGGLLKALGTNMSMAWVIAVGVLAVMTLVGALMIVAMPKFTIMQKLVDRINLVVRELLTGMQVIRAFSTQKREQERFEDANQKLTRNALFINRAMSMMFPMMSLLMSGTMVLIIWVGARSIDAGAMQVGEMMAFMQYAMQIIMSFLMLSMLSVMLPRALVSLGRIQEVLDVEPALSDPARPRLFPYMPEPIRGTVRFDEVAFQYPGSEMPVLSGISFEARPGTTTAFIGSTGSGKTTLINLVPRFFDVTSGSITIDGVDTREVTQRDLRSRIGFVPQKALLFSGDIEGNIKYGGREISDADMERAARIAQAIDFIEENPDKYQAQITQGGDNVSGGQRQRLAIARALAGNPDIIVFDDSFSALDFRTDARLRAALKEYTADATVLIVAQRVSTIMGADQIIVLDEGRIVGRGTHRELMKTCPVYQDIARTQLSQEELFGSEATSV
ncbi:MAG: ABC transporter ATP-binding protein/permease [Oscillospiraceae bacterium]|nr:ABC transporter ATP-binding protein/permease [Oscillospiraceae bacterium]